MRTKILKTIILILILLFYGLTLFHKIGLPASDDLGRHLTNGLLTIEGNFRILYSNTYSYTEPLHPFVNHHWLSGVVFVIIQRVCGWDGLVVFKIIVAAVAFAVLFAASAKAGNFYLAAILSLPAIFMLRARTSVRPEIFSYLFFSLFIYILLDFQRHPDRKRIFWLVPIQILWVNMHVYFITGICLVAGFLAEQLIANRKDIRHNGPVRMLLILLVLLIIACVVNPNGIQGALYPFQIFTNYGMQVNENQSILYFLRTSPPLDNISIYVLLLSIPVLLVSFLFNYKSKPIFYALAVGVTSVLAVKIDRLLPLFCFTFLPVACSNLRFVFSFRSMWQKILFAVLFFPAILYFIYLSKINALSNYAKPGLGLTAQSESSAKFFTQQGLSGPIFNDYDIGSYLIHYLYPQEKVFVDNRPEAYSASFFMGTYLPIFEQEGKWNEELVKNKFNVIFFYQYDSADNVRQFLYRRVHDPAWRLVYVDSYAIIFVRNTTMNKDIIRKFEITANNAEIRLKDLRNSPSYDEQVAAADTAVLLGRNDLGMDIYRQVVERWPGRGKIWMMMGLLDLRGNPAEAIGYLQKAIAAGHSTAEVYYYLAVAYENAGQLKKAIEATQNALSINPDHGYAKQFLKTHRIQ